jgi:feruloyl esterase
MLAAHCRIFGQVLPQVGFEVRMPAEWNGRFVMVGNGGCSGRADRQPRARQPVRALHETGVRRGSHRHRTLGDHRAAWDPSPPTARSCLLYVPLLHVTAEAAKLVLRTYYQVGTAEIVLRGLLHGRPTGTDSGAASPTISTASRWARPLIIAGTMMRFTCRPPGR